MKLTYSCYIVCKQEINAKSSHLDNVLGITEKIGNGYVALKNSTSNQTRPG